MKDGVAEVEYLYANDKPCARASQGRDDKRSINLDDCVVIVVRLAVGHP